MATSLQHSIFQQLLREAGLPRPRREWAFHWQRQWKVDYCWPDADLMLALEIEGGVWTRGGHTRGSGFVDDMEKYNALCCEGYRLLRIQPRQMTETKTVDLVRTALYG